MHAAKVIYGALQEELNALSYEVMWRYIEKQLLCGLSVIVDCPLAREALFAKGRQLACQVSVHLVSA